MPGRNDTQMLRWFDVIGIQRHLKVLGIFARLWYRDGKAGYLNDLPLTLRYVVEACASFPQLRGAARVSARARACRHCPAPMRARRSEAAPA